MLQNKHLLANIGFDTAENEPSEVLVSDNEKCAFKTIIPHLQPSVLLVHRAGAVAAIHGLALHAPVVLLLLHAAAVVLLDT